MLIRLSRIFTFFFVTSILGFIGFRIYSEKFASKEIPNNVKIYLITDSVRYKADDIYWNARESIEQGNWRNVYLAIHHLDRLVSSTGYDEAKIYRAALQGSVLAMKGNYIKALDCHLEALDFVKGKNYFAHMLYGYRELIKICKILKMSEEVKKYEHDQKVLLFQMQVPPLETIRLKDSVERCRDTNPYMAAIVAKELFYTSRNRGDLQGMGRAQYTLGYVLTKYKQDYVNGLMSYKKALSIYEYVGSNEDIALCYKGIGLVYHFTKLYTDAITSYKASLKIYEEEIGDKNEMANLYRNIGLVYITQSLYDKALICFNKSLNHRLSLNEPMLLVESYIDIANVYDDMDGFDNCIIYNQRALDLIEKSRNRQGKWYEGMIYNNLGFSYIRMNKLEDALKNLYLALKIKQEIDDYESLSNTFYNIGKVKEKQAKYEEAIGFLNQSLELDKKANDFQLIANTQKRLGDIYQKLGLFTLAASYFQKQGEVLQKLNK